MTPRRALQAALILVLAAPPAIAGGLSDTFGNSGLTSTEPDGPAFAFLDIATSANSVLAGDHDDVAVTVNLGAPFPFYGDTLTRLRFASNGYLSTDLADTGCDFGNDPILPATPSSGSGARVYPLHDDLRLYASNSAALHYQYFPEGIRSPMFADGFPFRPRVGVSVLQWTNVSFFGQPSTAFSFQALLFDDGSIYFSYPASASDLGAGATIGIQNADASDALQVSANTIGSVPDDFAVGIRPPHLVVSSRADAGPGTLRQAIADAPLPAYITFDPTVFNREDLKTILLTSGALSIANKHLSIEANDVCGVTLDAGGLSRVIQTNGDTILHLDSLTITGGRAESGAGMSHFGASATVLNSTFHANEAEAAGGGAGGVGDFRAENCTFHDNGAGRVGDDPEPNFGGGYYQYNGITDSVFRHCTFTANYADNDGGGIGSFGGRITLENCVLAGNSGPEPDFGNLGTTTSDGGNFIGDNTGATSAFPAGNPNANGDFVGTDAAPLDPLFAGGSGGSGTALVNFGGPTPTLMPLPGSPLIDQGNPTGPILDQRGMPPVGTRDIGAVETDWIIGGGGPLDSAPTVRDVTTPGDPITTYPPQLGLLQPLELAIDDMQSPSFGDDFVAEATFNAGLTVGPRLGASIVTCVRLTAASIPGEHPATLVLLGSNDRHCFTPIATFEVPPFAGSGSTQTLVVSGVPPAYRHYRVILPSNRGDMNYTSLEEIELLGELLTAPDTPRLMNFSFTPEVGSSPPMNEITLTFTSREDRTYGVQGGATATFSGYLETVSPTPDSYTTTVTTTFDALDTALFRVEELPPP